MNPIIEVAILAIGQTEIRELVLMKRPNNWQRVSKLGAGHCHCLPYSAVDGGYPPEIVDRMINKFLRRLRSSGKVYLRGHGDNICLKNFNSQFPGVDWGTEEPQQVHLPPWIQRAGQLHHIQAFKHKETHSCGLHTIDHIPKRLVNSFGDINQTNLAKNMYGYHCARLDCFELAWYHGDFLGAVPIPEWKKDRSCTNIGQVPNAERYTGEIHPAGGPILEGIKFSDFVEEAKLNSVTPVMGVEPYGVTALTK